MNPDTIDAFYNVLVRIADSLDFLSSNTEIIPLEIKDVKDALVAINESLRGMP